MGAPPPEAARRAAEKEPAHGGGGVEHADAAELATRDAQRRARLCGVAEGGGVDESRPRRVESWADTSLERDGGGGGLGEMEEMGGWMEAAVSGEMAGETAEGWKPMEIKPPKPSFEDVIALHQERVDQQVDIMAFGGAHASAMDVDFRSPDGFRAGGCRVLLPHATACEHYFCHFDEDNNRIHEHKCLFKDH